MDESILTSVKKTLGIVEECEDFDQDIIMHINSVLYILHQLGVGPSGAYISNKSTLWSDYLGDNEHLLNSVKSYMALKVRMMFDPPTSSTVAEAVNQTLKELEWRILCFTDLQY